MENRKKQCLTCQKSFMVYPEDLEFCKKINTPEPVLCNNCSTQRRMHFRNERSMYKRKCDLCKTEVISIFSPDKPYQVYCNDCWWSDKWDPLTSGQEIDFNKPVFPQIDSLFKNSPLCNMVIASSNNSDYTNYAVSNNNCYLIAASDYNERCSYASYIFKCRDSLDLLFCNNCEECYQITDCDNCYHTQYSQNCKQCTDCFYCYDCQSCSNCFGCVGLRHKNYFIFNKEYSPEEYEKKLNELLENTEKAKKRFNELKIKFPRRFTYNIKCNNSFGDYLNSCTDCNNSYDLYESSNCSYTSLGIKGKDCCRCTGVPNGELYYETVASPEDYHLKFCLLTWPKSSFLEYCFFCRASKNCFGCVSLHKHENCILNKQYTKADYEKLTQKLVAHMKETGEYGQFLDGKYSPFGYNETAANDYFPLTKKDVDNKGWKWHLADVKPANDNLLICDGCSKNYNLTKQEQEFYKKYNLEKPTKCFNCRHLDRLALRNPRSLWKRQCDCTQPSHGHPGRCNAEFETTYSPDRKELVYCQQCYKKEIY